MLFMHILAFLLTCSLPRFAVGDDAVLKEPLRMINKLNRQYKAPRCTETPACNIFLNKLDESDQSKHLGVLPAQYKSCEVLINDNEFQSSTELNKFYESKTFNELGPLINKQVSRCSEGFSENDRKRRSGLQYYNLGRLEAGQMAALNELGEIENILGESDKYLTDDNLNCSQSPYARVLKLCEQLKNSCKPQGRMDEVLDSTKLSLKNIENNTNAIKDRTQQLLAMGLRKRRTSPEGKKLEDEIKTLKSLNQLEEQTHPWILGSKFLKFQKEDLKKAISEQLKETKKEVQEKFKKITNNSECITSGVSKCDTSSFREFVDEMPDLPENQNLNQPEKLKHIAADSYINFQRCLHNAKMDQIKTADTVISQGGMVIAIGASLLASGPLALLIDTAWLTAGGVDAYKACAGSANLEINKNSNSSGQCPQKGYKNPSQAVALHGNCLSSVGYAALNAVPFGVVATKAARGTEVLAQESRVNEVSNLVKNSNQKTTIATRETDIIATSASVERRSGKFETKSGPDGEILRGVKPSTISSMSDNIKIIEVKNPEGKKLLYYQTREKLGDGTWVRSTREVQFDSLSGAIDANYPAGRELFEKIAKEKAGHAYVAFVDVGSLGAVNREFAGGAAAGDRYIKSVADKIMLRGEGKVTLSRLGGDEFGIIIDEANPQKVKEILQNIQKDLRLDVKGDGKAVFREEKIKRAQDYRDNPTPENLEKIKELAKIQQPDISIGYSQIGARDNLEDLLIKAEDQAKEMKISTALEFGRSAEKYGSSAQPRARPRPMYRAEIPEAQLSDSWKEKVSDSVGPKISELRDIVLNKKEEVVRFKDTRVSRFEDELGNSSYQLERFSHDAGSRNRRVTYEIPIRGKTGMLDGQHPESQKLVLDHFHSAQNNLLVMPKLKNLKYINYFEDGSKAGDHILAAVSTAIKKQMRSEDLGFKLGGADFLMSLSASNPKKMANIEKRINAELLTNSNVKEVIRQETASLEARKLIATKRGDQDEVNKLNRKIIEMKKFKPQLSFETLNSKELSGSSNFKQLIDKFDAKFLDKDSRK